MDTILEIIRSYTPAAAFKYQMLDRLRSDCQYYLGYGNRNPKILWAQDVDEHIRCMKALWNSFPEDKRPEWLTKEQIEEFEAKMKEERKAA